MLQGARPQRCDGCLMQACVSRPLAERADRGWPGGTVLCPEHHWYYVRVRGFQSPYCWNAGLEITVQCTVPPKALAEIVFFVCPEETFIDIP